MTFSDHDDEYLVDHEDDFRHTRSSRQLSTRPEDSVALRESPLYVAPLAVTVSGAEAEDVSTALDQMLDDVAQEYGFRPPGVDVEIGDASAGYELMLYGERVADGAFNGDRSATALAAAIRPAVVDHLHELLNREAVVEILSFARRESPAAVSELVPNMLQLGGVRAVFQRLLRERIPLKPISVVVNVLGDNASHTRDPAQLAERVRAAMWRPIRRRFAQPDGSMKVLRLALGAEQALSSSVQFNERGSVLRLTSELADKLESAVSEAVEVNPELNPPILACDTRVRHWAARFFERRLPSLVVLSTEELQGAGDSEEVAIVGEGIVAVQVQQGSQDVSSSGVWGRGQYVEAYVDEGAPRYGGGMSDVVVIN